MSLVSGATRSYEIIDRVAGRSGIRLARQQGELGFNKLVDIKTIPSDQAEIVHALVVDEARLRHANIVSTIDVLVEGSSIHVVMEHIEGPSLAELLQTSVSSKRKLPVPVAAAILHDVLLGLEHAHGAHDETMGLANMLHCDVSPQNVIVGLDGLARLVNLGAPRTPSSDETPRIGKPAYLAPEALEGKAVDRTADIYSCGVLLWELLTGSRLFKGVRAGDPKDAAKPSSTTRGVSKRLDAIVMRALHRDPRERYQTPGYMAKALADAVRLATRATVAEALETLRTGADVVHGAAEPSSRFEHARDRINESIAIFSDRLRAVIPWMSARMVRFEADSPRFHAATRKLRLGFGQLSFATRMLLAFSVASILVLGLLSGRGRPASAKARIAVATAKAAANVAPRPLAANEEPPIEIDDEPTVVAPAAVPAPAASVASAPARPRVDRRTADAKPSAKSIASQLLH